MGIHFFLAIRCNKELASQISSSSEIPRIFSKLYRDPTQRNFLKFLFKFHFNSGQVPMGKVVPYLELFPSIFSLEFLEPVRSPFNRISLNYFKLIQINVKPYCSSGLGHPRFLLRPAHACPRATRALPAPADRSAPPVSGTAARHCGAAHPSDATPLSVSVGNACAAHVARECHAQASAGRRPPIGARPHGTPTPGLPPFPSSFPLCCAAAEPLAHRSRCSTRPPVSTPL
jgi:hypothetical protein